MRFYAARYINENKAIRLGQVSYFLEALMFFVYSRRGACAPGDVRATWILPALMAILLQMRASSNSAKEE